MQRFMVWISVVALVVILGGTALAQGTMGLININTADEATLVTLDQVGKSRAQAIIQYRMEYGSFKTTEDLKKVSGIGDKIFAVIKEKITVGDGQ